MGVSSMILPLVFMVWISSSVLPDLVLVLHGGRLDRDALVSHTRSRRKMLFNGSKISLRVLSSPRLSNSLQQETTRILLLFPQEVFVSIQILSPKSKKRKPSNIKYK